MKFTSIRRTTLLAPLAALSVLATAADAQFGRNKVQYETFSWQIFKSEHFDTYFYPAESLAVHDAARMAERWYARLADLFRHNFYGKSLIFYADHPDFEQTNVIPGELGEGTGGVTEGLRTRVIMPLTGVYADNHHVLGHELVHVFQYNIAEGLPAGLNRMSALPLWLIEGMAEYLSLGRDDALTAMWMRDAVMRDRFPTIYQLSTDPRFFPYRYGQALWAYVGGKWGDRAIVDIYRSSLRLGFEIALLRRLGMSADSLSKEWAEANKALYGPLAEQRTHPDSVGQPVIPVRRSGDYNIAPSISPDGRHLAFFSSRDLFGLDLFLADAQTGRVIKKLASPQSHSHFDALSSINSSGDWSPDSKKFAFIVFADGDNEIAILDVASTNIERRVKLPGVGAVKNVAWSPDGSTLAFSGLGGGVSDLYLLNLESGSLTQLTDDRYADLQPAWSPDGRSIAFVTDRGPGTSFERYTFDELNLALYDVETRQIRVLPRFQYGKGINPQFSADGRDIYFVSDQDGISDIYRLNLASGSMFRVTTVATGISGITRISPALSVSRATGRLVFSVFRDQGQGLFALEASQAVGQPVDVAPRAIAASLLPPHDAAEGVISRYLADMDTGLPMGDAARFRVARFRPSMRLEQIGQPSLGVSTGSAFGTMILGGIEGVFGDQLGDQLIYGALQAEGGVRDIGGQFVYMNMRRRWNWGTQIGHIPYLTGGFVQRDTAIEVGSGTIDGTNLYQVVQRMYFDQVGGFAQYPFSTTRRVEVGANYYRLTERTEAIRFTLAGNQVVDQSRVSWDDVLGREQPAALNYFSPNFAYVGDNAQFAFTSPISGERFRFSASPTFGSFTMQTVYADWRRYWFKRPFTLAVRGMHMGRYGKDADSPNLYPEFLGQETLIRGYGYNSFTNDECPANTLGCPVFHRLLGSKLGVANLEVRIPLFGVPEYGLINFPDFATHISPFVDFGIAYTGAQRPSLRFTRDAGSGSCTAEDVLIGCAERIPVFSAGLSARINILGYMVFEAYVAHPYQRPKKDWVWGFQLAPGW